MAVGFVLDRIKGACNQQSTELHRLRGWGADEDLWEEEETFRIDYGNHLIWSVCVALKL
jgi:hypothetical protein